MNFILTMQLLKCPSLFMCPHKNVNKENTYTDNNKVSWSKANYIDIAKYRYSVEEKFKMIDFNCDLFRYKDVTTCVQHGDMLQNVYEDVLATYIDSADECIPKVNTGKNKEQQIPGWNNYVVDYHQEALYLHYWWKVEGRPHQGYTSEMKRITRARYYRVLKMVKKDHDSVRKEKWLRLCRITIVETCLMR